MARVFIIGGTREARQVAEKLAGLGHAVMSSLAGVTAEPRLPVGAVRMGGYGSDEAMADFIRRWGAEVLIDCAHPFATAIKRRLAWVAEREGLLLWVYRRAAWQAEAGDNWHFADGLKDGMALACELSGDGGGRIFAALGRQQFAELSRLRCEFLLLRQVPGLSAPDLSGFASPVEVISAYPADSVDEEIALLQRHKIQVILCKESGGSSGFAKLAAARTLSLPVVIIRQPTVDYPQGVRFFEDVGALRELSV